MNGREKEAAEVTSTVGDCGPSGTDGPGGMDRRQALKVLAMVAATPGLVACGTDAPDAIPTGQPQGRNTRAAGTVTDPDLVNPVVPWERSLTTDELESLASLCDVVIPADARSPSASQVGAHDFIDEWVSAPYDWNRNDKVVIRGGLVWLDLEAARRFGDGRRFRDLAPEEKHAICDDICYAAEAAPGMVVHARFFDRVRDLTATAFWTTEEGMGDLGYVGNVPLAEWKLPPQEVLDHLGL